MTIATAIQAAQQKVANAYSSVSTMGGTLPQTQNLSNLPTAIESIPSGGEWKPNPDWWDIETILKNDTRTYDGKAIILYTNADDFTSITISSPCVGVATSDGSFYTSTTTHTWDRTKDKIISSDVGESGAFGTRYLILYFNTEDVAYNTVFSNFYKGSVYAVFGCNLTKSSSSRIDSNTFFYNNYTIQSFKFLDGCNLDFGTNFTNFCYNCYSLQKLPNNLDVSSGTNFHYFCYYCYSLQKLPDNLDVSNGTDFSYFCALCCSLQKLSDNLDFSSGTNFASFCGSCYSLQKLSDNLDVSSGTNFGGFCGNCYSLQKLSDNLDVSKGTSFTSFCLSCYSLIKANIKLPSGYSITNLSNSNFLSMESLRYIAQNAPTVSSKTLTIGATNITRAGGASGTIIQTLTNKGWTVN